MYNRKFWDTHKVKEFPDIKDWSDPQNHLRFSRDVKGMDWKTWYWFHPSAYLLMQYGSIIMSFLMFLGLLIYLLFNRLVFLSLITGFLLFILGKEIFKKVLLYKVMKNMNHYDIHLREEK